MQYFCVFVNSYIYIFIQIDFKSDWRNIRPYKLDSREVSEYKPMNFSRIFFLVRNIQ